MPADNEILDAIRTLHDLSKTINSTLGTGQVEEMLLQKTSQLMGSAQVLILLLDQGEKSLSIHNSFGFQASELPAAPFENIHSFAHCIVHKGSVITLAEMLSGKDRDLVGTAYPQLLRMFFAPLEIQGEGYGLLGVMGSENNFSEIELEILCAIGSQAAVAMGNASLYAIGKIGIDDTILRKVDRLAPGEERKMQEHPRIGAKILGYVEEMKEVIPGVLHHHEWFDGSGYPDGLVGHRFPCRQELSL